MTALLLALACAPRAPSAPAAAPATHLPTPFAAEEIRDAFRPGTHVVFVLENAGKDTTVSDWVVTGWTGTHATIAFTTYAEDRTTVLEPTAERTSAWAELRDHARFEVDRAERSQGQLLHPLGTLEVWLYVVQGEQQGLLERYWFAKELPGPPVRFTVEAGGTEVFRMEQVLREVP